MNCSENYYELIGIIEAYPDDAVTFSRPFNIEKKSDKPDFSVSDDRKISIQMKPKSGSLKESAETSVAGDSYEVTVSWEVERVTQETYLQLETLKNSTNHLIVRTFGDGEMFVRAVSDGYEFQYEEGDGVISCTLTIRNVTGAQRVV
jgi:hypothetical protein|nr:MAG TPA: hypothetical protein [Caudoviricetes sp.]